MKKIITIFSIIFGFYTVSAQTITVVQPNGGEVLVSCQQYTIMWNITGTLSEYYDIDYSLDGGIIWASVATNYYSPGHTFLWTVPNAQSTTCLVRIMDKNNNAIRDSSNALFTINYPIQITSPNGGETLTGASTHPITWNSYGVSGYYNIEYSLNGGGTWIGIVSNTFIGSNSYNWVVPNMQTNNQVMVRVMDAQQNCRQDVSNAPFTIVPATPVLLIPNGGQQWYQWETNTITWNSATLYETVRLEYSTNGGATWTLITASASNSGSYNWSTFIGNTTYTDCRIRISNTNNSTLRDTSNSSFTMKPPIRVTYPNASTDTLRGCTTYNLTADVSYDVDYVEVWLSVNGGATYTNLGTPYIGYNHNFSYAWAVPNTYNTNQARIRMINNYATGQRDSSDALFVITPGDYITVTSPNGGETIQALTTQTITWTNTTTSGLYQLEYSTNGGSSWTYLANNVTGNSYNWNVANIPSTQYLIRVTDQQNVCKFDVSNAVFTVSPATPVLLIPNGGQQWYQWETNTITWNSATLYETVRLEYSTNGGATWTLITASASNSGSYNWSTFIGNTTYTDCRIRISNTNNSTLRDTSNSSFTMKPPIRVTYPNASTDTLRGCTTYNLTADVSYDVDYVEVWLSVNGGATYTNLGTPYIGYNHNFSYAWAVPNTYNTNQARIRMINNYATGQRDSSDALFVITPGDYITVTSPNGGETIQALTTQTITWTNTTTSGLYQLEYSTNGGSSWTYLANNVTGNSYNWNVANIPSTQYLIRVTDQQNVCKFDVSNAVFTVSPATPVLLIPNGGQQWYQWETNTITWNSATLYETVRLEYSTNGGATWTLITASASNSGSYNWSTFIGNTTYTDCRIRISNTNNSTLRDTSNSSFTMKPPIRVTYPNASTDTLRGCTTYNLTADVSYDVDYVEVWLSVNGGATYTNLGTPYIGYNHNFSYAWAVPNTYNTNQARIRMINNYATGQRDSSDALFVITPGDYITVTSPNGGETIQALTTQTITWTNTTTSGLYQLEYSTNGGSSWTYLANNVTGNSYNWNVANIPSTQYLIRVTDQQNVCKFDVSNAVFTVSPATPVLLIPNGGQQWYQWETNTITWNSATLYETVRLEYSTNGGATWTLITASASNSGSYNWSTFIGNTTYTDCRIRISNTNNSTLRDTSNSSFTMKPPIRVTYPNASTDTLRGCTTYNLTADVSYDVDYVEVWLSVNGGATYTNLGTPYIGYNHNFSYAWAVPNTYNTNQARIRMINNYATGQRDSSDALFVITPGDYITVTSPNGGETIQALTTQTITWTNTTTSGLYQLEYSTNGGSSWTYLANNVTGNSYNWNVANIPSTQYLIRVTDQQNVCKFDVSNAVFTVSPATPVLLIPNGGQQWYQWETNTITWNSATLYETVRLEYSTNGGATWTLITASASNSGSYNWSTFIGNTTYTDCRIRISNTNNSTLRDTSNSSFTMKPPIRVTYPNASTDTLRGCTTYNLTADVSYDVDYVEVWLSVNGGATYTNLGTPYIGYNHNFSYAWAVPNTYNTNQARIRMINNYATGQRDSSDALFVITPGDYITVTSPNGGETIQALTTQTITWTNTTTSGLYQLEYSTNGGSSWTYLANNVTGNSYNWNVANIPSTQYLIRVTDQQNVCKFDVSNAVFTVSPATPVLLIPNGGQVWYGAESRTITWNPATLHTTVRLEYSLDNSATWNLITNTASNTGSYNWSVPNIRQISPNSRVRISNTGFPSSGYDTSNNVLTLKPAVTIITPNGGDELGGCTVTSITIDRGNGYQYYQYEYSLNGGATWTNINNYVNAGTTNPFTYNWTLPNLNNSQARVRVYPYSNQIAWGDTSNTNFSILRPVTVIQPNYGGTMQVGSVYNIMWISDGISNIYDISYSIDGGSTWITIVNGYVTSNNTYAWTVPNTPSSNCRVRVRDNVNPCKEHISDNAFIISGTAPSITLTNPNGLDSLIGCQSYNITWTENGTMDTFDLAYSTNAGSTWTTIVNDYPTTTNTYNWVVPNINSVTALVRVAKHNNATLNDWSNALFEISSTDLVAGPDTTVCANQSIQLYATGGGGSYSWQPSTYLSNASVQNPICTPTASITYVVTSTNGTCVLTDTVYVTTNSNPSLPASVSVSASPGSSVCTGTSVTFTATPTNGGSTPTYQWRLNGSNISGATSSSYTPTTVTNGQQYSCVMTSNLPCVSGSPATSNTVTMSVSPYVTPSITISASVTTICSGASVVFTATPTNGGSSPQYQWRLNGNNISGANASTYTSTTLTNGNVISCVLTSSANCANPTTATSNNITITVNSPVTPAVSIVASVNPVCINNNVTFTATAVNGGTTPSYQWYKNGVAVGTNATTYTTNTIVSGDSVWVVLYSSLTCVTSNTVTSNKIYMTTTTSVTPSVSIAVAPGSSVCAGTSVTFTATPTNGGTAPTYQWKRNGTNTGTNSSTLTVATPVNNDVYTVVMTSNAACLSTTTATSNAITLTVTPTVTPTISISASATSICTGASVTFTANITNGGSNPQYQWRLNGNNISGANASTYTSTTLTNGNVISCVLTSNATCATTTMVTSNSITITVNSPLTPSVLVSPSSNPICAGNSVTFTATPTNGGTTPTYQWYLNGNPVGTNSSTYTNASISNNDSVRVLLTTSLTCVTTNTVTSSSVFMSVTSTVTPFVSIAASPNGTVCTGTSITLTATPTNGGAAPTYQWKRNGINTGTNGSTLSISNPVNNDVYVVVITSSANCASPSTDTSNAITLSVTPSVAPTISVSTANTNICSGAAVTLTASITNGGSNPQYQWKLNGNDVSGATGSSYSPTTVNNNDVYSCQLISDATCATPSTVNSNNLTFTVSNPVTPSVSVQANNNPACAGSLVTFTATPTNGGATPSYQWYVNGNLAGTNSATYTTSALQSNDSVWVVLSSSLACVNSSQATSNKITITINMVLNASVSIAANPGASVCSGTPITLTATAVNPGPNPVYQWKKNGTNMGSNSTTLSITSPTNGDVYTVEMATSQVCAQPAVTVSNSITINVTPSVLPNILINNPVTTICQGATANFTSSVSNAGANPTYQWLINGNPVNGANSANFSTTALTQGAIVSCQLTSSANCASPAQVVSNAITMNVNSPATPSVSIVASANPVCSGSPVTFSASSFNGGNPIYQWQVNSINVGTNAATFSSSTLNDGDLISVNMISTLSCVSSNTVTSNIITLDVTPTVSPTVNISVTPNDTVCEGTAVSFTAISSNEGLAPVYQWKRNGGNVGSNSSSYTLNAPVNGDQILVVLTSNANCASPLNVSSNVIVLTVDPMPNTPVIVAVGVDSLSSSVSGSSYVWYFNGVISSYTGRTIKPLQAGNYQVVVRQGVCESEISDSYNFTPVGISEIGSLGVFVYPNPAHNELFVVHQSEEEAEVQMYDMQGRLLTSTTVPSNQPTRISVETLAAGTYFVTLKGSAVREKVIVVR